MTGIPGTSPSLFDRALLLLRAVLGAIYFAHGWQKVFTIGIGGITAGFTRMGVPLPGLTAPAVAVFELVGGALLIAGLLSRVVPLLFAIEMLGAIVFVHGKNGFFMPSGYEFVLALMSMGLALTMMGPGRYSVDAALAGRS